MKYQDALDIINENKPTGFMVSFEKIVGTMLHGGHFPEKESGEPLIKSEIEAWDLANNFAEATKGRYINIYVIGEDYTPVKGYEDKKIINR